MPRYLASACLGLLLYTSAGVAGDAPLMFAVSTAEGKTVRGDLERLKESWELRAAGQDLRVSDWLTVRQAGRSIPAHPIGCHLILTNGDCISVEADSLALSGERLTFTSPWLGDGKPSIVPLSSIALIWRAMPEQGEEPSMLQRRLLAGKRRHDMVVLRNGDVIEGILNNLGPEKIELDVRRKKTLIETKQVALIALSSELASDLRPKGTFAQAVLGDGSRLTLRSATSDGKTLTGTSAIGIPVRLDLDKLVRLDLSQGRVVYLSDLTPAKFEHTPYLGVSWPLVVNGSVAGRDLRVGGSVFDRGLGMHSASRVSYALPAGTHFFESTVGLDDTTGRKGSVRIRVLVDGKERDLGRKDDLKAGDMLAVRLDVTGARELTLVVDFGEGGDVGDHVNWVDARLIR